MTLVLAHRGSGPFGPEPENTLAAFAAAAELGADGVELDVRRSRDRQLVVHHDAFLPDGRPICETAASELPSSLPSLAEALDSCAQMIVNVEVKNSPPDPDVDPGQWVASETARLLAQRVSAGESLLQSLIVSSFSLGALAAVREAAPGLETAWLAGMEEVGSDLVATAQAAGVEGIHPSEWLASDALIEAAHAAGLAVRVWTVNDAARLAHLGSLGVEAVITNDVALARQALG